MKHFHEMSATELAAYAGPVYTARCVLCHRHTGSEIPHDFQASTTEMREALVAGASKRLGMVLSRRDYKTKATPTSQSDSDGLLLPGCFGTSGP